MVSLSEQLAKPSGCVLKENWRRRGGSRFKKKLSLKAEGQFTFILSMIQG